MTEYVQVNILVVIFTDRCPLVGISPNLQLGFCWG